MKITYFNKREREKQVTGVILSQRLTITHPSLVDGEEETRVLVTAHKREGEEFKLLFYTNYTYVTQPNTLIETQ